MPPKSNIYKFPIGTEMDYIRKSNMAKIQDGRQNGVQNIFLSPKANTQRNLAYDIAFPRFSGSKNSMAPEWIMSKIKDGHIFEAAILDFRHIVFPDVIHFGAIVFLDPENLGKVILQAKFH